MRGVSGSAIILMLFAGCLPLSGEIEESLVGNRVPDSQYVPQEGDRACLYAMNGSTPVDQIAILTDLTAFDKYGRCLRDDDPQELATLEQQGWLHYAPPGTSVFISKIHDRQHTGAGGAAEVKILEGTYQGRVVLTPLESVTRLKKPDPEP